MLELECGTSRIISPQNTTGSFGYLIIYTSNEAPICVFSIFQLTIVCQHCTFYTIQSVYTYGHITVVYIYIRYPVGVAIGKGSNIQYPAYRKVFAQLFVTLYALYIYPSVHTLSCTNTFRETDCTYNTKIMRKSCNLC